MVEKTTQARQMGRPTYKPSQEQRKLVRVLKASGIPNVSIAAVLHIASNTLEKHFRWELEFGRADVLAALTMKRFELAMAGNASALNKMIDQAGREPLPNDRSNPPPVEEKLATGPKLGKKEQRRIDAEAALDDPEWAELLQ